MDADSVSLLDFFFASFERLVTSDDDPLASIGENFPLPKFQAADVSLLLELTRRRFQNQSTVLDINRPVWVIGDIHGNLQDLIRVFRECELASAYLFLGDYIDRGEFSLECILFLFALTCRSSDRIFLIRGNHECHMMASNYGFRDEVLSLYPSSVFDEFVTTFQWMPLAAVVAESVFCVHGGLSPGLHHIRQLRSVVRPIEPSVDGPMVYGILWNDPSTVEEEFGASVRITGMAYGPKPVHSFLSASGLSLMIRGHECVDGVKKTHIMKLFTVFSSSNYGGAQNRCGVILVGTDGQASPRVFDGVITQIPRSCVSFSLATRADDGLSSGSSIAPRRKLLPGPSLGGRAFLTFLVAPKRRMSPICSVQLSLTAEAFRMGTLALAAGQAIGAVRKDPVQTGAADEAGD
jgi:protein phosphatase